LPDIAKAATALSALNHQHIERAVRTLRKGGVIAYPTEGVWGLGCDPFNREAVMRILELKHRSVQKGLILVAGSTEQLAPLLVHVPLHVRGQIEASWPGPNTWVVPLRDELPAWVTGKHRSVALRVSAHPQLRELCLGYGAPIISTSANPQGRTAARSALAVRRYFGARLDYVLPGPLGGRSGPSAIRDAMSGQVLRAG
jgi:L-threonylcarbamoyladenylate synthase